MSRNTNVRYFGSASLFYMNINSTRTRQGFSRISRLDNISPLTDLDQ
jgi:hypothetical protein